MRRLPVLLALLLCALPAAASAGDTWMTLLLGGRKIGQLHVERRSADGKVTTTKTMSLQLYRAGKPMVIRNVIGSVETDSGKPLAFSATTRMSNIDSRVEGTRTADGQFRVNREVGGQSHLILLDWPRDALLAEGQRLAIRNHAKAADSHYRMRYFDPASENVVNVAVTVLGRERVDLPGGAQQLTHIRERLRLAKTPQTMDLWLDDDYRIRKGSMQLLGDRLDMLACSKACATAPNQDVDLLRDSMIDAPRMLTQSMREQPMRYLIHIVDDPTLHLISTSEQHLEHVRGSTYVLNVGNPRSTGELPPQPSDTAANDWVQSDAPKVRALARHITRHSHTNLQRIRALKAFVHGYINDKGLDVGYASALETLKTHHGDCTEYAVLLAALARSLDIPTRVVTGMVYADRFAGRSRVFVPHAWVQAWIDGRWHSYDAALGHFDSSHIAFALGNGDPWQYFAGMDTFGHLKIHKATSAANLVSVPPPSMGAPPASASLSGGGR